MMQRALSLETTWMQSGFTLLEMAVVLVVLALILGGILVPLSTQIEQRQIGNTQKMLEEVKEALIGYVLSRPIAERVHLPCPDRTTAGPGTPNDGIEDFDVASGLCVVPEGNLPWATLGVPELDSWGGRFRYRVDDAFSRRAPASPTLSLSSVGSLQVCQTSACAVAVTNVPAVILSGGKNRGNCANPSCTDETENSDGDDRFVARTITPTGSSAGEFDDVVVWISQNILFNRLIAAERLP
jgi:prepilin-type N-terminal cleavage/methylation domain-containing protein